MGIMVVIKYFIRPPIDDSTFTSAHRSYRQAGCVEKAFLACSKPKDAETNPCLLCKFVIFGRVAPAV